MQVGGCAVEQARGHGSVIGSQEAVIMKEQRPIDNVGRPHQVCLILTGRGRRRSLAAAQRPS